MNRTRILAVLWPVIVAACALPAIAADAPPVRIAILAGEGDRAVDEVVVAQLEAALTGVKDITLLERAEVRKILAEQKLSASGLDDPATAVKLGKVLSVELFLFLERIPKTDPAVCRVQFVEAKTGIALAADTVTESDLSQKTSSVAELLSAALAKQRVPPPDRRYVGLLEVHSEEPGRSLDGLAEALGMFLMADLGRSPNVIVLDRERVDRLAAEKTLSALEVQLKTSSALISGGIRRASEPDKLDVTLELRAPGASAGPKVKATVPSNDMPELRRILAAAVLEGLGTKPLDLGKSDPRAEALAFAALENALFRGGDPAACVRAGEAAYALWPDERTCEAAWDAWIARKFSYGDLGNGHFSKLTLEDQRRVLEAAIRQWTLASDWSRMRLKAGKPPLRMYGDAEPYVHVPESLTLTAMPEELKPLQEELRSAERAVFALRLGYCRAHYDNPEIQAEYWEIWYRESCRLNCGVSGLDDLNMGSPPESVGGDG